MFVAAAPICIWAAGAARGSIASAPAGSPSVSTLLLLSALLSAQYVIWLAPAAGIAWDDGDGGSAVLTAIAILLTQVLLELLRSVLSSELPALLIVVLRNAVLIALAVSAIARLRRVAKNARRSREDSRLCDLRARSCGVLTPSTTGATGRTRSPAPPDRPRRRRRRASGDRAECGAPARRRTETTRR